VREQLVAGPCPVLWACHCALTGCDRWGAVRGSRKRDTPLHRSEKTKARRGPPVPHRNPEIKAKGVSPSFLRLRLRAGWVIPLPFGFDFSIAAVPPLPSPGGKVSEEGRASRSLV